MIVITAKFWNGSSTGVLTVSLGATWTLEEVEINGAGNVTTLVSSTHIPDIMFIGHVRSKITDAIIQGCRYLDLTEMGETDFAKECARYSNEVTCPVCGSVNIWDVNPGRPLDMYDSSADHSVMCRDCKATWVEKFQLRGITSVKDAAGNPVFDEKGARVKG